MDAQKIILFLIIIVLLAGLAWELKLIEETLGRCHRLVPVVDVVAVDERAPLPFHGLLGRNEMDLRDALTG